jgi:hypothetical protein
MYSRNIKDVHHDPHVLLVHHPLVHLDVEQVLSFCVGVMIVDTKDNKHLMNSKMDSQEEESPQYIQEQLPSVEQKEFLGYFGPFVVGKGLLFEVVMFVVLVEEFLVVEKS